MSQEYLNLKKQEQTICPTIGYLSEAEENLSVNWEESSLQMLSLPSMNEKILGIPRKHLITIGARTSMGKTVFAVQAMMDFAKAGKRVYYISFEMTPTEILTRMFCNLYEINNMELKRDGLSKFKDQWKNFKSLEIHKLMTITTGFGKTWEQLEKHLDKYVKVKPDAIIIDFIQGIQQQGNAKVFIDDYIKNLRTLSITHNFSAIIVSQVNRSNPDSKDKTPQLHQLKSTGFLEEHSDIVILLDWPYKRDLETDHKKYFEVWVAKNRQGMTGFFRMEYYPQYYKIIEPKVDHVNNRQQS